jgi:hypothetical protein
MPGTFLSFCGLSTSERKIPPVRSTLSLRGALVLLSGIAALAPLSSAAVAGGSSPFTLNTPAPELVGSEWRNTPGKARLTLAAERGKVTILHFWTFG